jgi:hypothetical protein
MSGQKSARLVFFIACISDLLSSSGQSAPKKSPTVGVVTDQVEFENGGCQLLPSSDHSDPFNSERFVFMSDFNGRAVMNINGHDILFNLVRSTDTRKQPRKGDRSQYWYSAGSISVEVDYTVTGVCPPDDESCEVSDYRATIRITAASARRSITAHGLCGV